MNLLHAFSILMLSLALGFLILTVRTTGKALMEMMSQILGEIRKIKTSTPLEGRK